MITSSTYLPIPKMHLKIIKKPCYFSKYLGSRWFNRSDHQSTWPWSKALYLTGMDSLEVGSRTRQTRKAYREPVSNVNQELSLWRWPLEADKLGPNAQSSLLASQELSLWKSYLEGSTYDTTRRAYQASVKQLQEGSLARLGNDRQLMTSQAFLSSEI